MIPVHVSQDDAPESENFPAAQRIHVLAPDEEYFPAVQATVAREVRRKSCCSLLTNDANKKLKMATNSITLRLILSRS